MHEKVVKEHNNEITKYQSEISSLTEENHRLTRD